MAQRPSNLATFSTPVFLYRPLKSERRNNFRAYPQIHCSHEPVQEMEIELREGKEVEDFLDHLKAHFAGRSVRTKAQVRSGAQ